METERASALFHSRKGLEGILTPPTPTISSNTSTQNFEIPILFNAIERSENCVFVDDKPLKPSGQGL